MGLGSIWHWLILGAVVLLLFGKGRIADVMGDFGKGIKNFKKGLNDEPESAARIAQPPASESPQDSQK